VVVVVVVGREGREGRERRELLVEVVVKVALLPVKPQMMVVRVTWGVSVRVQRPVTGRVVVVPVVAGGNQLVRRHRVWDILVRVVPVYRVQLPVRPYAERVVVVVGGGVPVLLVLPRVVVAPVGRLVPLILHPQLPILVVVEVAPVLALGTLERVARVS